MLNVSDLTPLIGTLISGLDLAHGYTPADLKTLRRTLATRGVVVLRGQQLTAEQFLAFSHAFAQPWVATSADMELTPLSNIVEQGIAPGRADNEVQWQAGGAHLKTPYRATLQYAVEIPLKDGAPLGDTLFASMSAAHDALDPALQAQLHGMRAVHKSSAGRRKRATTFYLDSALTQGYQGGVEHPVVRAHPDTGCKCLYVNAACTAFIRGLADRYSSELLAQLIAHLARAEFIYRHAWQIGDVLLWDNASTQHRTMKDYDAPLRRLLYRVVVKDLPTR